MQVNRPKEETSDQNSMAEILMLRRRMLENRNSPDAYCDLGVAIIQSGDPKSAIVYLKQATKLNPDHARSHYNLALAYQKLGYIDNALNAYENVIRLSPKDHEAWANVAVLFHQRNEYDDSIHFYQKALELDPQQPKAWSGLAVTQYLTGAYEDSIESAKKAIELDGEDFQSWQQLGLGYYALRDPEESVKAFLEAIKLNETSEVTWNNLGNSYLLAENEMKAEEAYRTAIRIDPSFSDSCFNLGELLFKRGEKKEAITWFSRVMEKDENDAETLEYLVKALLDTSSPDAVSRIRELIRLKGDRPQYVSMLADAYSLSGRKDLEVKTRLKLASENPNDKENIHKTARLLQEQGNRDMAYSFLKSSLPVSAKDHFMWSTFAQLYLLENNLEEEFQCLTQSVKADPGDGRSWYRLGIIALENGSENTGLKYLKNAKSYLKNNTRVWSRACELLLMAGKYDLAYRCLEELLPLLDLSPKVWNYLFRLHKRYHRLDDLAKTLPRLLSDHKIDDHKVAVSAELLFQFGYTEIAIKLLKEDKEEGVRSQVLTNQLCRIYLDLQDRDNASELIRQGLDEDPEKYDFILLKSELEYCRGEMDSAFEWIQKAHALKSDDHRSWFFFGKIEQSRGNHREALDAYDESLSRFQANADAWSRRGEILRDMAEVTEAETSYQSAVAINRKHAEAWLGLAKLRMLNSDYDSARKMLLRSVAANREFKSAWQTLAEVFDHLEEEKKAAVCRQQAENPTTDVEDKSFD